MRTGSFVPSSECGPIAHYAIAWSATVCAS
jgi:hypothetical protein